jgi:hypothetical protein
MSITATGLGVNCNTPAYMLDVNGSANINTTLRVVGLTTLVNSSNTGTLGVAGATTLAGTLGVTGLGTFVNSSNTGTLGVAGQATFVNSSNTGTLGVAGQATFVNSSNTGTLGVAGLTRLSSNVGIFTAGAAGVQLDILGGHQANQTGGSNLIAFQFNTGGFRHFITSRHNGAVGVNTNAIDFWLNNSNTAGGSSTSGTGNVNIFSATATGVGINNSTPSYTLDVNGTMQAAIFYSTITSGGTATITPNNFGIFYNVMTAGTYTLAFSASQASSNIGKYISVRNNSGSTLSFTLTGVSGITSPVTLSNAQSATFVVATTTTYALF